VSFASSGRCTGSLLNTLVSWQTNPLYPFYGAGSLEKKLFMQSVFTRAGLEACGSGSFSSKQVVTECLKIAQTELTFPTGGSGTVTQFFYWERLSETATGRASPGTSGLKLCPRHILMDCCSASRNPVTELRCQFHLCNPFFSIPPSLWVFYFDHSWTARNKSNASFQNSPG